MINDYIYRGNKKLRLGITTGSCAAASAKAAAEMLLSGKKTDEISLMTPKGILLHLKIRDIKISGDHVSCAVQKDSGDDPDITDGILIYSKAEKIISGIEIVGGEGVGTVTKEGLDRNVGEAAINTVPREMITSAVKDICGKYDYSGGIKITVFVPGGEEIAKKTYNPRLGIKGGISIIGTTGIVEPMSNSAVIETIRAEEKVRKAEGKKNLLLTVGNYSETFLSEKYPSLLEKSVMCSNFIGDAIDFALEFGFESVLILGHAGKLVKLGAGIMNTHSSNADGRMEVLVTCGVLADVDVNVLKKITECVTFDAAFDLFEKENAREKVSEILMKKIDYHLNERVKNEIKTGAVLFSFRHGIIGKTSMADEITDLLSEEYND